LQTFSNLTLAIVLSFHGSGSHARNHIPDQEEVQDDDRNSDKDGTGCKAGEFRLSQGHQADSYRIAVLVFEEKGRKDEVRPRPGEGGEGRIDDHRLRKRQGDSSEDPQVGSSVDRGCFIDGDRDRIEETFLDQVSHRSGAGIDKDQSPEVVDHLELGHQDIKDGHRHEGREHAKDQCSFHQVPPCLEFEAGDRIGGKDKEDGREKAAEESDDEGIEKPLRIVVHVRIREEGYEGVEGILGREESVEGVDGSCLGEGSKDKPQAGEDEDGGDQDEDAVGQGDIQNFFDFMVHR